MKRAKIIITNLKFSKHSESNKVVGFISKMNGLWKGVRENDDCKKIIVLLDTELAKVVSENILYKCRLVPMSGRLGYVAVTASPVTFSASLEVEMLPRTYKIRVKYGNKTVVYDPESADERFSNYDMVVKYLVNTHQIKNIGEIIDELRESINETSAQYV